MNDMLVRLLSLPDISDDEARLNSEGIIIRRPIAPEKSIVIDWANKNFSTYWANEVDTCFSNKPVSCFIAQKENDILGFACYEATSKNFFGPTGTLEHYRNKGIGKVLLIKSLEALREMGYAYAIVGGVGPSSYYEKVVKATIIPGSENSIYNALLKKKQ